MLDTKRQLRYSPISIKSEKLEKSQISIDQYDESIFSVISKFKIIQKLNFFEDTRKSLQEIKKYMNSTFKSLYKKQ